MEPYSHKVQYYETDGMGVVHHSNYIRWMEEARGDFLEQAGLSYAEMEKQGHFSPVLTVSCAYKSSARYGDTVLITTELTEFGSARFTHRYSIVDSITGALRATGETTHCFLNREGRPISLRHADAVLYQQLLALVSGEETALSK